MLPATSPDDMTSRNQTPRLMRIPGGSPSAGPLRSTIRTRGTA